MRHIAVALAGSSLLLVYASSAGAMLISQSPREALGEAAAVIEGRVTSVEETYDDQEGPRYVAVLSEVQVHLGALPADVVELRTLGGLLPDGKRFHVSDVARLTLGTRYIIFLQSGEWFHSPVLGTYAYRLEHDAERGDDVLIAQNGTVLTALADEAFEHTGQQVLRVGYDILEPFRANAILPSSGGVLARGMPKSRFLASISNYDAIPDDAEFSPLPHQREYWSMATATPSPANELMCFDEPIECAANDGDAQ
jgi:hypothetical protein